MSSVLQLAFGDRIPNSTMEALSTAPADGIQCNPAGLAPFEALMMAGSNPKFNQLKPCEFLVSIDHNSVAVQPGTSDTSTSLVSLLSISGVKEMSALFTSVVSSPCLCALAASVLFFRPVTITEISNHVNKSVCNIIRIERENGGNAHDISVLKQGYKELQMYLSSMKITSPGNANGNSNDLIDNNIIFSEILPIICKSDKGGTSNNKLSWQFSLLPKYYSLLYKQFFMAIHEGPNGQYNNSLSGKFNSQYENLCKQGTTKTGLYLATRPNFPGLSGDLSLLEAERADHANLSVITNDCPTNTSVEKQQEVLFFNRMKYHHERVANEVLGPLADSEVKRDADRQYGPVLGLNSMKTGRNEADDTSNREKKKSRIDDSGSLQLSDDDDDDDAGRSLTDAVIRTNMAELVFGVNIFWAPVMDEPSSAAVEAAKNAKLMEVCGSSYNDQIDASISTTTSTEQRMLNIFYEVKEVLGFPEEVVFGNRLSLITAPVSSNPDDRAIIPSKFTCLDELFKEVNSKIPHFHQGFIEEKGQYQISRLPFSTLSAASLFATEKQSDVGCSIAPKVPELTTALRCYKHLTEFSSHAFDKLEEYENILKKMRDIISIVEEDVVAHLAPGESIIEVRSKVGSTFKEQLRISSAASPAATGGKKKETAPKKTRVRIKGITPQVAEEIYRWLVLHHPIAVKLRTLYFMAAEHALVLSLVLRDATEMHSLGLV